MKLWTLLMAFTLTVNAAFAQETEQEENAEQHSCCSNTYHKSLYVAPIQLSEQGIGFSVGYESQIGRSDLVSWVLPVIATFNPNNNSVDYINHNVTDPMFYVMPGVRIYPKSRHRMLKSAIGPSLIAGWGQQTAYYYAMPYNPTYYPTLSVGSYVTKDKFVFGAMLNYSLILAPSSRIYMGADLGLGFTYLNILDGQHQGMEGLCQFGIKVGYKF